MPTSASPQGSGLTGSLASAILLQKAVDSCMFVSIHIHVHMWVSCLLQQLSFKPLQIHSFCKMGAWCWRPNSCWAVLLTQNQVTQTDEKKLEVWLSVIRGWVHSYNSSSQWTHSLEQETIAVLHEYSRRQKGTFSVQLVLLFIIVTKCRVKQHVIIPVD